MATEDKPKFTPGPWGRHNGIIALIDENNIRTKRIATLDLRLGIYEREANAHAISAVPDMYEALKMAQLWLEIDGRYDMRTINAAINKAEGRQA